MRHATIARSLSVHRSNDRRRGIIRGVPFRHGPQECRRGIVSASEYDGQRGGDAAVFRDSLSKDPKVDLRAAFAHIDNALAHGYGLFEAADTARSSDADMLYHALKCLMAILSDMPQSSFFLYNKMIDIFFDTKALAAKIRQALESHGATTDATIAA